MKKSLIKSSALALCLLASAFNNQAIAQQQPLPQQPAPQQISPNNQQRPVGDNHYSLEEVVAAGHSFFGTVSGGLATAAEKAFSSFGMPNAYILGEEAGGAIIGGLRYGEGTLYTKDAGDYETFWQGPTVGWDFGGDGARTMMLIYNLPTIEAMYGRFPGVSGSAYVIGGVGFSAKKKGDIVVVPITSGVGARLGINAGYLKFTTHPTWNPF